MTTVYEWERSLSHLTCEHARNPLKKMRKYTSLRLGFYPVGKKGKKVYVCARCKKPLGILFILYRAECECGEIYSSPWEFQCEKCHRIEYTDFTLKAGVLTAVERPDVPPYRGWEWLRQRLVDGHLVAPKPNK